MPPPRTEVSCGGCNVRLCGGMPFVSGFRISPQITQIKSFGLRSSVFVLCTLYFVLCTLYFELRFETLCSCRLPPAVCLLPSVVLNLCNLGNLWIYRAGATIVRG